MSRPQLSVLIPAAGASRRLGQIKQLVRYGSGTLIQNAVKSANSINPLEIMVITGAYAEEIRDTVHHACVRWVHNPQWSEGLGGSIATGVVNIHPDSSGLLILLCDQWRIQAQDLQALVKIWDAAPERIVVAETGGQYMPPVIFPSTLFKQLRALKGDTGARSLFNSHPDLMTPVSLENAAFDLDTHTHLALLRSSGL
ncbi:MAG: nucleotidyltransferase family protein [Lysobacterales bacterium]